MEKERDYFADEESEPKPKQPRRGWGAPPAEFPPDVSLEELARVIDLSTRMVTILARDGVLPRASYGRYQFLQSVQGYIRQLRNQAKDQGDGTLSKARARLTQSKADMAEIERMKIMGEVAPIKDLYETGVAIAGVISSRMQAIPAKLANQLLNMKLARDVERIIREEIVAALEELAALQVRPAQIKNPKRRRVRSRDSRGPTPAT